MGEVAELRGQPGHGRVPEELPRVHGEAGLAGADASRAAVSARGGRRRTGAAATAPRPSPRPTGTGCRGWCARGWERAPGSPTITPAIPACSSRCGRLKRTAPARERPGLDRGAGRAARRSSAGGGEVGRSVMQFRLVERGEVPQQDHVRPEVHHRVVDRQEEHVAGGPAAEEVGAEERGGLMVEAPVRVGRQPLPQRLLLPPRGVHLAEATPSRPARRLLPLLSRTARAQPLAPAIVTYYACDLCRTAKTLRAPFRTSPCAASLGISTMSRTRSGRRPEVAPRARSSRRTGC